MERKNKTREDKRKEKENMHRWGEKKKRALNLSFIHWQ